MSFPRRVATYYYKLKLPPLTDGSDVEPIEWSTSNTVDLRVPDEELLRAAKSEFTDWCDRSLDIRVETSLDGTVAELATAYEERIRAVTAITANALCSDDSSEFSASLRRILKFLSPAALERLEDGIYQVGDLGDEPRLPGDERHLD